jgi:endonuclease YncB( thermonuclease family)
VRRRVWLLPLAVVFVSVIGAGCSADGSQPSAATVDDERLSSEEATVVHVIDGDTFDVILSGGTTERVRLPQIDTPERDQCGFAEPTATLEELILGETVRLVPTVSGPNRDDYGRLLRAAELDGDDVGQLLVRPGLARWVPRYADEDPRLAAMYEDAERQARDEGAGLWSSCDWS